MELASFVIAIISLASGVGIYFFDVRKKFDELLRDREGILNKTQALDLVDLYLASISSRLLLALHRYSTNDLPSHLQLGQEGTPRIMLELTGAYNNVVRHSVRPMVTNFRLRGRHRFDDLVSEVSRKKVDAAFISIQEFVVRACNERLPPAQVLATVEATLKAVGDEGGRLIRDRVEQLYPRDSDR